MTLFELVAKLTFDKSEFDKGVEDAEQEGKSLGDKISGAFGTVAKAGAVVGGAAVAAGGAIYGMSTKAAGAADRVDKMSQKLGLSRTAFQELDFVASQSGTSVESMRGGMRTLANAMTQASQGAEKQSEYFKRLGLSIYDSNGNLKDQETMLFETINALQGMKEGTEKATLANKLLGRSGSELMPLLNGEQGSMEEMRQKARDLGLVLNDDVIDAGVKLTDTIDQTKRAFDAITTNVGAEVMPLVQKALEFVLENLPMIQTAISGVMKVFSKFVTLVVDNVKKYIMPTLGSIGAFINDVFAGDWSAAWGEVVNIFKNAWKGISSFLSDMMNILVKSISKVLPKIIPAVIKAIQTIGDLFPEGIKKYILPTFGSITAFLEDIFKGDWHAAWLEIINIFKNAFEGIKSFVSDIFTKVVDWVKSVDWVGVGTTIKEFVVSAFTNIKGWITERFNAVKDAVSQIDWASVGETIMGFITTALGQIVEWAKGFYTKIAEVIKSIDWAGIGHKIWELISGAFSNVVEWFTSLFSGAKDGVSEGIDWMGLGLAIWDYIKSAFSAVAEFLSAIFMDAWTAIQEIDWLAVGTTIWDFITSAFSAIGEWALEKFGYLADIIQTIDWAAVGTAIWDFIISAFGNVAEWAMEKFGYLADVIKTVDWLAVGNFIWDTIISVFSNVWEWAQEKFNYLGDAIKNVKWDEVGKAIWDGIKTGIGYLIRGAGTIVTYGINLGKDMGKAIKDTNWGEVGGTIWNGIKTGIGYLVKGAGTVVRYGINLGSELAGKIKETNWNEVGTTLWNGIKTGVGYLTKGAGTVVTYGINLGKEIADKVKETDWEGVGDTLWTGIKTGVGFLKKGLGTVIDWATDLAGDIKDGISSVNWGDLGTSVWDAIKGGFTSVTEFFSGLFDFSNIHIKWPHITVTWEELAFGIQIPSSFHVEWYAKGYENPYLFTSPGILGGYGFGDRGNYQGGEILYSHDRLMKDIREASGGAQNNTFYIYQQPGEDAEALARRISDILSDDYDRREAATA